MSSIVIQYSLMQYSKSLDDNIYKQYCMSRDINSFVNIYKYEYIVFKVYKYKQYSDSLDDNINVCI